MPAGTNKIFRALEEKRCALLDDYNDEDLHKLRVSLRRLRSLLKQHGGIKARRLRHALGTLADHTTAARDWDTLANSARMNLAPGEFTQIQPWLEQQQAASHRCVIEMLDSKAWIEAVANANELVDSKFIARIRKKPKLKRAKRRVKRTWCSAQGENSVKRWHKLRVAIKELRYNLNVLPPKKRTSAGTDTSQQLKQLQTDFGMWHDNIVHARLVRQYAAGLDVEDDSALLTLLGAWRQQLEAEAQTCLANARAMFEGQDVLRAPGSGKSTN